jgi:hypothetical protein
MINQYPYTYLTIENSRNEFYPWNYKEYEPDISQFIYYPLKYRIISIHSYF